MFGIPTRDGVRLSYPQEEDRSKRAILPLFKPIFMADLYGGNTLRGLRGRLPQTRPEGTEHVCGRFRAA